MVRNALEAITALMLILWTSSAVAAQPPQMSVTFNGKTITATGATPRGQVIFFGESQEDAEYTSITYSHYERFADADTSGSAHVDLNTDVVPSSIWAVVDIASGSYVVLAPAGGARKSLAVQGNLLRKSAGGDTTGLDIPFEMASILVVRPGVGAWEAMAADGGAADEKGHKHGKVITPISQLHAVRDPKLKPISTLQGGDVVVVIEPQYLFFYATQVNGR